MKLISRKLQRACLLLLLSTAPLQVSAEELTIVGASSGGPVIVSDERLTHADQVTIITETPWTEGTVHFEGPSLASVLVDHGWTGQNVTLTALNDYSVTLEQDQIFDNWPIIARLRDGEPMSVREKGPYWLMFPFSDLPDLRTETYYALSIWQLAKITIE